MQQEELSKRLQQVEANAKARLQEESVKAGTRDPDYYARTAHIPREPIIIASTEDIGTMRVRANHVDAAIDYCKEQEKLKAKGLPI